jgi:SAM-dependent methyltransferase
MANGDLEPVVGHYEQAREEDRLLGGMSSLELVRTREILGRHLPPSPARVVDVGGGTGVHADWLLAAGFEVHLVDVTPRHVEVARRELGDRGLTAEVGDARDLALRDETADVVLLLGPLYHLIERDDRIGALREARRVVRPGGLVAAAAISRFASLFDGLARGFIFSSEFAAIVGRDIVDGRHENPENRPDWFTTAFFHRPEELRDELAAADLHVIDLVGIEGLAGWLGHLDSHWDDPQDREVILTTTRLVEAEPSLLGLSAHLLALARRPV